MAFEPTIVAETIILTSVGKKILDETWDAGRKWLLSYYANHQPRTIELAEQRASSFLNNLAAKVERLEAQQGYDHEVIDRAMIDPTFGIALQRALIHSSETSNTTAHVILANLVAERLTTGIETTKAVALLAATDVVSTLTTPHFAALACHAIQRYGSPTFSSEPTDESDYQEICRRRTEQLLLPYSEVDITETDMRYLIATSCGVHVHLTLGDKFVKKWQSGKWTLNIKTFKIFPPMANLGNRWHHRLWFFESTTIGDIIGLSALEATSAGDIGLSSLE